MSTQALVIAMLAGGCVDPRGSFEDFGGRVIDAAVVVQPDAPILSEVPDIGGEFLMSFSPVLAPDAAIQSIVTIEFTRTETGAVIDLTSDVPLDRDTREPVPNTDPVVVLDRVVDAAGQFTVPITTAIPGRANPLSGTELHVAIELLATIRDEDLFCGLVNGEETTLNLDLDGSTFAAVRIAPGTTGSALPPPLTRCPEPVGVDAGASDATPADAGGQADGAAADAAPPADAAPADA